MTHTFTYIVTDNYLNLASNTVENPNLLWMVFATRSEHLQVHAIQVVPDTCPFNY